MNGSRVGVTLRVTHGKNWADGHDEINGTTPHHTTHSGNGSGSIAVVAVLAYLRLLEERTHELLRARVAELLFNHLPG